VTLNLFNVVQHPRDFAIRGFIWGAGKEAQADKTNENHDMLHSD
jgi:hypothetical protein